MLAILSVLWEAFETVILPRRVQRKLRFTRGFYLFTWPSWRALSLKIHDERRRESLLAVYGPLSLVVLFAAWDALLVIAFGVLHWALGSRLKDGSGLPVTFGTDLYMSGTTLFTLGLGDIIPVTTAARSVAVVESAIGLGLIALVISYLPTLYQAFARREVNVSLLAARTGSPPTAQHFLEQLQGSSPVPYLIVCEQWAAEVLEGQISYPVLSFFRSQHLHQSWLAALITIMDICALIQTAGEPEHRSQAALTSSMARHALKDIAKVFHKGPQAEPLAKFLALELPPNNYNKREC